jgi:hypothetical protein
LKQYERLGLVLKAAHEALKIRPSKYLIDRGINATIQVQLGIGYLEDWYTFPIRNADGKIEGAVARKGQDNPSQAKYVIPKGQSPNLLYVPSWQSVLEHNVIWLTFGVFDSISLYLCGAAGMSTTTGKQLDPDALNKIRKLIYICPDLGEEAEGNKLAARLGWRSRVMKMNYPLGCKDISDVFNLDKPLLMKTLKRYT